MEFLSLIWKIILYIVGFHIAVFVIVMVLGLLGGAIEIAKLIIGGIWEFMVKNLSSKKKDK